MGIEYRLRGKAVVCEIALEGELGIGNPYRATRRSNGGSHTIGRFPGAVAAITACLTELSWNGCIWLEAAQAVWKLDIFLDFNGKVAVVDKANIRVLREFPDTTGTEFQAYLVSKVRPRASLAQRPKSGTVPADLYEIGEEIRLEAAASPVVFKIRVVGASPGLGRVLDWCRKAEEVSAVPELDCRDGWVHFEAAPRIVEYLETLKLPIRACE